MDLEYVYAAAILHELDREINERNMKSVLEAAGADVSESRIKALIAALEDVNIDRAVADASPELSAAEGATAAAVPAETDRGGEEPVETADETLPEPTDEEVEDDEEGGGLGDIF